LYTSNQGLPIDSAATAGLSPGLLGCATHNSTQAHQLVNPRSTVKRRKEKEEDRDGKVNETEVNQ
jgi:hypothetical protein